MFQNSETLTLFTSWSVDIWLYVLRKEKLKSIKELYLQWKQLLINHLTHALVDWMQKFHCHNEPLRLKVRST